MAPFNFKDATEKDDLKKRLQEIVFDSDYMKSVKLHIISLHSHTANEPVHQLAKDETKNSMLPFYKSVEVVSVERTSETTGRVVYRFPVLREYLNPAMTLHGGLSCGVLDTGTTWVLDLIRKPGFWMRFGTSRSLNITFIRPAMEGEVLLMDCEASLVSVVVRSW